MLKCKIDGTEYETILDLHTHLRKLKIKQEDYYSKFEDRRDLLTGEPIEFKNAEQYMGTYFKNKTNMKKWFEQNPVEAKTLARKMFEYRVKAKKLQKAPTEVEMLSSDLPSIFYYEKTFGYEKICKELGLSVHKDYSHEKIVVVKKKKTIIIDTREQKKLKFFGNNMVLEKLDFGDYAEASQKDRLSIERKEAKDAIHSFVRDIDRLRAEMERAKKTGAHIVVVCESSFSDMRSFDYIPHIKKYTKVKPSVFFHNVRDICQEYDVQFLFCDGRGDTAICMEKIMDIGPDVSKIDLQYYKNLKKFKLS
jgi:hypothetical protein